jgi:hypothetical protein
MSHISQLILLSRGGTVSDRDRVPPQVHLRINGEKYAEGSGGTHGHVDPTTSEVDAQIPLADKQEVELVSGMGKEGGREGLEELLRTRSIALSI